MATFGTMQARLRLILQAHLVNTDLASLLNRCYEEEVTANPWHRLRTNTVVNSIAPKGGSLDGSSVTATINSANIVGSGTAFAVTDIGKVMRIGADDALYIVNTVTDPTHLTLTTDYPMATNVGAHYEIFPLVYALPSQGAQRITDILLTNPLVERTREQLNRQDPARRSSSDPCLQWAPYGRDSCNRILFELWPHASANRAYTVEFIAGFVPMCNDNDLPLVPSAVIENKALWDCALAVYSLQGDEIWAKQAEFYRGRYEAELEKALYENAKQYGSPLQVQDIQSAGSPGYDQFTDRDWGP